MEFATKEDIACIKGELAEIKAMLQQMVPAPASTPMGPSMAAFLKGGLEGILEQNRQRAAAKRAASRRKKRTTL